MEARLNRDKALQYQANRPFIDTMVDKMDEHFKNLLDERFRTQTDQILEKFSKRTEELERLINRAIKREAPSPRELSSAAPHPSPPLAYRPNVAAVPRQGRHASGTGAMAPQDLAMDGGGSDAMGGGGSESPQPGTGGEPRGNPRGASRGGLGPNAGGAEVSPPTPSRLSMVTMSDQPLPTGSVKSGGPAGLLGKSATSNRHQPSERKKSVSFQEGADIGTQPPLPPATCRSLVSDQAAAAQAGSPRKHSPRPTEVAEGGHRPRPAPAQIPPGAHSDRDRVRRREDDLEDRDRGGREDDAEVPWAGRPRHVGEEGWPLAWPTAAPVHVHAPAVASPHTGVPGQSRPIAVGQGDSAAEEPRLALEVQAQPRPAVDVLPQLVPRAGGLMPLPRPGRSRAAF